MLVRPRAGPLTLVCLAALSGCESGSVGAGDVLVVAQIDITPPDLSLVAGSTQQLHATPKTSSGIRVPNRQVTWSSDDPGLATVSSAGMVTAVASGATRINAAVDGVRASIPIEIAPKPVVTVSVVPDQVGILVGETADLTAIPRDSEGQPLAGRAATFASDNPLIATVSPDGHVTAVAPGLTVARATVEGKVGTANVSVNARPAAQLNFQTEPVTGAAGVALAPIRIEVQNDRGGTVTIGTIPVTVALADNPTGAVLGGARTVNAFNGVASFNDLTVNQAGIGYSLRATSGSLNPAVSAPFAIVAGPADALSISTQPSSTGSSGTPLPSQPVVQIRDASGNAVAQAGVQVTAALEGAGATLGGTRTVASNAQGVAVFTNLVLTGAAGTYTLLFAAPGLTAVASTGITIGAGSAATLTIVQQPAGTAQSGVILSRQPWLQLEDAQGNAVAQAGLAISAALQTGGGFLDGTSPVVTDATGRARFVNLLIGGTTGTRTLRFSAASLSAVISDNVVVGPGPAVALAIVTSPPPASASGAVLVPAPVVQVADAFGNPVDPETEITITTTIAAGVGGVIGGTTAAITTAGAALFNNLILTGPAGSYTLLFSGGGLTAAVSNTIAIGSGAPTALFIVTQPSASAGSGTAFGQQPVVQLRDGSGNPVPRSGVDVTAAVQSGEGTLGGTTTRATNASGQAVFTDLVITGAPGPRTLRFSATGLTGATSTTIEVTAVAAATLKISTEPSATAQSGAALVQQPVLELTNAGAPVSGATITAIINSGPAGASLANAAAVTDAGGIATFSGLAITGAAGDYTLRFESGAASAVSGTIALTVPPEAARLLLATPPASTAASGTPLATQPVLQIADAGGAPVAQAGTTVTAVIATGPAGATLAGATAVSDGSGTATFSGLTISGVVGSYTLRFESGTLTTVTSGTITISPLPVATKLLLATPPASTAASGTPLATQPVVQIADAGGTPFAEAGTTVTAVIATGPAGATLAGATAVSDGAGAATFSGLTISGVVGSYTLRFESGTLTPVTSGAIALGAGTPATLTMFTQPPTSAENDQQFDNDVVVRVQDAAGNNVPGVGVTAAVATGAGIAKGTLIRTTASNGRATFNDLELVGLAGPWTLVFTAPGGASVVSRTITLLPGEEQVLAIQVEPPTSAQSGVNFSPQPKVELRDTGGNLVTRDGVRVNRVLETISGLGSIGGSSNVDTDNGVASWGNMRITGSGSFRIRFTSSGMTSVTSAAIVVTIF